MTDFSILDLLDLPPLEREVFLRLTRNGPADADTLAVALGRDAAAVRAALDSLAEKRRLQLDSNGRAEANMGRIRRRATLPSQLWPTLLASERLYSEQEIATLRTVVPILQFARAKLSEFTDHGPNHALRVKSFATQLGAIVGLSAVEQHLLGAAALFHDVGNVVDRQRHHIISQETVERLAAVGELPFSRQEAALIGLICRWHRREYKPHQIDQLRDQPVRTGLLASILRVADAMDIDQRRLDHPERFTEVLRLFFADQLPYWTSIEEILGLRISCVPQVQLQVFTNGQLQENMQIAMLRTDLAHTPLDWSVSEIAVDDTPHEATPSHVVMRRRAIVAFPFESHSMVMAARSSVHLKAAGYAVELLCYPNTHGGTAWLWREALSELDPTVIDRLVVIGDGPDETVTPYLFQTVERLQAGETAVSILNRHEANWTRVPQLLKRGVEVILGGDWAYFWGTTPSKADLAWGRIAALCTRDPTQSSVELTDDESLITQGLLKTVYDAASQPAHDTVAWAALAEPIVERIASDDRTFFAGQASGFIAEYATPSDSGHVEGRMLHFDWRSSQASVAPYWTLEAAIEQMGRALERGVSFTVPYALATWRDGDCIELLAMNHWREEKAIPIRLLYPVDLGPLPIGNESTVYARMSVEQANRIVPVLIAACNRQKGV